MTTESTRIYWRRDQCFEVEKLKLEQAAICSKNKELIRTYHRHLFKKQCSNQRVTKLSAQLRRICALVNDKTLDELTKEDIDELILRINTTQEHADETKKDYRRGVKQFYKFLGKKELTEDILVQCKNTKETYRDLITEEEIQRVVNSINNVRDRALLMFLHETGARIGEFLNIRLKDIIKGKDVWRVRLNGKTGERIIPFLTSIPYIAKYLEQHPLKDEPDSYLWLGENTRYKNKPLEYVGVCKIIKRSFVKAKMPNKRINCHHWRHSRATILASKLTETMLCHFFGWTLGSPMVKIYVHASGRDLDNAFLSMHGLRKPDEEQSINKPRKCICEQLNEPTAQFCTRCGKPLDVKIALESEQRVNKVTDQLFQLLTEISQKPDVMQQFLEFQKKYNEKKTEE